MTLTLIQTVCPNCIAFRAVQLAARSAEAGALVPVFEKSATEQNYLDAKTLFT